MSSEPALLRLAENRAISVGRLGMEHSGARRDLCPVRSGPVRASISQVTRFFGGHYSPAACPTKRRTTCLVDQPPAPSGLQMDRSASTAASRARTPRPRHSSTTGLPRRILSPATARPPSTPPPTVSTRPRPRLPPPRERPSESRRERPVAATGRPNLRNQQGRHAGRTSRARAGERPPPRSPIRRARREPVCGLL